MFPISSHVSYLSVTVEMKCLTCFGYYFAMPDFNLPRLKEYIIPFPLSTRLVNPPSSINSFRSQIHLAVNNHGVFTNQFVILHPRLTDLTLEILPVAFTGT